MEVWKKLANRKRNEGARELRLSSRIGYNALRGRKRKFNRAALRKDAKLDLQLGLN